MRLTTDPRPSDPPPPTDGTALRPRRRPIRRTAATVTATLLAAIAGLALGLTAAPTGASTETAGVGASSIDQLSAGARPVFVPVTPCRLADTRPAPDNVGVAPGPLGAQGVLTIDVWNGVGSCAASVPTGALAVSLNVTSLRATDRTFLTIWGGGTRPLASSLNPAPGQPPTPNAVVTPLDATGAFRVFNDAGQVEVVIDVVGYFVDHDHDDLYFRQTELYTQAEVDALLAQSASAREAQIDALEQQITSIEADVAAAPVAPTVTALTYSQGAFGTQPETDPVQLRSVGTFTKLRGDSVVRLDWTTMIGQFNSGTGETCSYHLRVNGATSDPTLPTRVNASASVRFIGGGNSSVPASITDHFMDLPVGQHTVTIWAEGGIDDCVENDLSFSRTVWVTELPS
ncbi:MAG: hypothetical protein AAGG08_02410 [Actinomycetota bacterium]